jgi:glycosyltransferase involved in cell wall biosynthesis
VSSKELAQTTICVPTFNQSQYVVESVLSALAQTSPVEVFVSNDGSTDDTALVLKQAHFNGPLRIVNHTANLGIGRHVNWVLQQPTTKLIARLDSDDSLHSSYIQVLSDLLKTYPQAGYAHCAIQEMDEDGRPGRIRTLARKSGYENPESSLKNMVRGYKVAANIILFRREALADAGFGDATLNFAEDYDLCIRIADAGWGNAYTDQVLASYRVWGTPTRQSVSRKLSEIQGLHQIYSSSLKDAFLKRGWNTGVLRRRRLELALGHSAYLDTGVIDDGEWKLLQSKLTELSGIQWTAMLFERRGFGKVVRLSLTAILGLETSLRSLAKKVLRYRHARR